MATTSSRRDRGGGPPPVRTPGFPGVLIALGLGAGCLAGLTAGPPQAGRSSASASSAPGRGGATAERLQAARRLYGRHCASCHEDDGTGGALRQAVPQVPDFSSHAWHARRSDAQLVVSILEGKGTRMPPFHGKISEDGAQDLVGLLRTFDPAYEPGAARRQPLGTEEFDRRLRQLDAEMEELKRQFREASAPPRKP
jgi:mono/diheme cytochrome c family protein